MLILQIGCAFLLLLRQANAVWTGGEKVLPSRPMLLVDAKRDAPVQPNGTFLRLPSRPMLLADAKRYAPVQPNGTFLRTSELESSHNLTTGKFNPFRKTWTAESLPNPTTDPQECGMGAPSRVCDPEKYLAGGREKVLRALNTLDAGPTYPGCGTFEMGVVVVRSVEDGSKAAAEEFARKILINRNSSPRMVNS